MSSPSHNLHSLVNVKPERHRNGAHTIHPYFGKLDPALAHTLIKNFSDDDGIILDPFCGSGTVLHEALLLKRSVIGWDSSPLATLLATAKLLGIQDDEQKQLKNIREELYPYSEKATLFRQALPQLCKIPPMPRVNDVSRWFEPNAIHELAFLKDFLKNYHEGLLPAAQILALTAFSRIVIPASNQEGESSYRRVQKANRPGRVISLFLEALKNVAESADRFNQLMKDSGIVDIRTFEGRYDKLEQFAWGQLNVNIVQHDTRSGQPPKLAENLLADLVVSSPPYLMSWDYGLYHKFRFYWLDFDLDTYEETEIGRHLRRKKDDVERYRSDMQGVFLSLSSALTQQARVILINAPSVVYGEKVDTNKILEECGRVVGWQLVECVPSISIPGPHHGMYASLKTRGAKAPGESGKREHVLIFQRVHA